MFRLSFYPIADSYLAVLAAAVVLLGLLWIGPAKSKTPGMRRTILAALRLIAIAMVLFAMLRPTLVYTESKKRAATLVVMADRSRSMSTPDGIGGKTRWQTVQRMTEDAAPELERLSREFEVKGYTFDSEAHSAELTSGRMSLPEAPDGKETAIGASLDDVLRAEAGKRLLGVILISDGAQRAHAPRDLPPQSAVAQLKHLGFPLFTFPIGESRRSKDVAVSEMLVPEQVSVKNRMEIGGQIRIDGFANQKIPIRLHVEPPGGKNEVVDQIELTATGNDQLLPYAFTYIPPKPGEYKVAVEAVQQPGERVVTNNQMSTFVTVLKTGLNLLYLEGELRWEQKYLLRALGASTDIKADYVRIDVRNLAKTKPRDLADRFKVGKYDVYMLGDLDSTAFTQDELLTLGRTVYEGAGLIMLGGYQSFAAGGYADTPLTKVLPVVMDKLDRQQPGGPVRSDIHVPGPLPMRPTPLGARHFAMQLASTPQESAAIWQELPPLEGANRFTGLSAGAIELASTGSLPLLVAQPFGKGRAMAFAGDSTWRWWARGFEAAHKRFWRQIAFWLARRDQQTEGTVWVKVEPRRVMPLDRVEFTAGAKSPLGDPVRDLSGTAELTAPDGTKRSLPLIRQEHLLTGTIRETQTPGDYTVTVTLKEKDAPLGTARGRFTVDQQDLELDNSAADPSLMETLAAATGGQRLAPEQLPDLIRRLGQTTETLLVHQETKLTFWDTWPFFLAMVLVLGVEWFLRKRWGLV